MTLYGENIIGKPTLAQIEVYIAEKNLFCKPKEVYDYWEKKKWLTKKGAEPKTLESAISVFNGIAVNRAVKKNIKKLGITKLPKKVKEMKKRIIRKNLLNGRTTIAEAEVVNGESEKKIEKNPYETQLEDSRWKSFRKFIFAVRGKKCESCGSTNILQVHHPKYKNGRMAWEYTCNEVVVLCKSCHEKVHHINN